MVDEPAVPEVVDTSNAILVSLNPCKTACSTSSLSLSLSLSCYVHLVHIHRQYIYIHMYTYTYTCTCLHLLIHIQDARICEDVYARAYIPTYTNANKKVRTYIHLYVHVGKSLRKKGRRMSERVAPSFA